jgi:NitT/TauT family transport system permease protein
MLHPWSLGVAGIALVFGLWALLAGLQLVDKLFLPTPAAVLAAGHELAANGQLWSDITASLLRVLAGFGLSALVALPLGIAMGANATFCRLLEPLLALLRYMPAPAFIPLLIIYFGLGELPKVLLIFIGTLFFNTLMIMDAVKFVPRELLETALTLGGKKRDLLLRVIAPFIAPQVLDAFRINMAAAWNLVIVAELVAADSGLGKRITLAQRFLRTDQIFLGLIVIGLIGLVIASLVNMFLNLPMMGFIISILGVFIFAGLIAFDTQRLKLMYYDLGGDQASTAVATNFGALSLYLNFINLFQFLPFFAGHHVKDAVHPTHFVCAILDLSEELKEPICFAREWIVRRRD